MTAKWGAPIEEDRAGRSIADSVQPRRYILRFAGLFTQLAAAGCLLLGTIAFVLLHQNKSGGSGYVIAWAVCAMVALVFGGLMVRGGLISLLVAAILDIAFGSVLLVIDKGALAGMMRVLAAEDIELVSDVLFIASISLIGIGVLCFLSIPQAIRYARWLHAGESQRFSAQFSSVEMPLEGLARPPTPRAAQFPEMAAGNTNPGFPPPPVPTPPGMYVPRTGQFAPKSSMWIVPTAPVEERRSRRRLYFALGGFAIGFGAGIGVLLSSTTRSRSEPETPVVADTPKPPDKGTPPEKPPDKGPDRPTKVDAPKAGSGSGSGSAVAAGSGSDVEAQVSSPTTVQAMLQDQRSAIARGDADGVIATLAPTAIGFGIDADELVLDKAAIAAQVKRDLGDMRDGTVEIKFSHLGEEAGHAWIAQELELSGPGRPTRRLAITQLAAATKTGWRVLAWHWAVRVRDEVAERLAILGTKPSAKPVPNKLDGPKELDKAVRDAFASRMAFAGARSDRSDGFNFGSGPGEKIVGGGKVKEVFQKLRGVEIKLHDSAAYVVGVSPAIGVALVNADFTHKTRAATELTQTFRVLAVLLKEGSEWKLVLTQWSHGGPIRG